MSERRLLVEAVKVQKPKVDPEVEQLFVFRDKKPPANEPPVRKAAPMNRVPLTLKLRGDFATALKRASLERQLNGTIPNTQQEILEEALEPWLRTHGYIA